MFEIFDGAMGTMLQAAGLPVGAPPEIFNLQRPEVVADIHRRYIEAGATIITTNSFGASPLKLNHFDLARDVDRINRAAVEVARHATDGSRVKVAADIGPSGKFIAPLGALTFDDAYKNFYDQARALAAAQPDYFILETFIDIQEIRAALLACKDAAPRIPIIAQMSFQADGRTVTGTPPDVAALILSKMGAHVVGVNCSLGPEQLIGVVEKIASTARCPISCQPNAGLPILDNGRTIFPLDPDQFAHFVPKLVDAGATFLGGCCGTSPDHIRALKRSLDNLKPISDYHSDLSSLHHADRIDRSITQTLSLASRSKIVNINMSGAPTLIGERINPTGRKKLAAEIASGSMLTVKRDAVNQVKAGAHVLDVNMGVPGADQSMLMRQAVTDISNLTDAPLAIDTPDAAALEQGLIAFPGRALINSVSAEVARIEKFIPLAKRYGAAIIVLPLTDKGVPQSVDDRIAAAKIVLKAARDAGLDEDDFLLDALTMPLSADKNAAINLFETLKRYRAMGLPSTCGLSNISFGLPNRPLINSTFLTMALSVGLRAPIVNPFDDALKNCIAAGSALLAFDPQAISYSTQYANVKVTSTTTVNDQTAARSIDSNDPLDQLRAAVTSGDKDSAIDLIDKVAMQAGALPTANALSDAMAIVGRDFAAGKIFLPHVLLAAEAMRAAFDRLSAMFPQQRSDKGKIVLATVKGDVHDLGKNIVAALIKNAGFTVIDLGIDVDAEEIVKAVMNENAEFVGLCALMTTTMHEIDVVIDRLRDAGSNAKVLVGGAAVTADYAAKAGADFYSEDALAAVDFLNKNIDRRD